MAIKALNGLIGCFGFETKTVSNTAVGLTSSVYNTASTGNNGNQVERKIAKFATISVETDQVRYRMDGTDPTSSVGHLLGIGDVLFLNSEDDIRRIRFIRVTNDATIMVSYA